MKKELIASSLIFLTLSSYSNDLELEEVRKFEPPKNKYGKTIYPFRPYETSSFYKRIKVITETSKPLMNFKDIYIKKLNNRSTLSAEVKGLKPWTSTFWPLQRGGIANPYQSNESRRRRFRKKFSWKANHKKLVKRLNKLQKNWKQLSTAELNVLAPSEKYDILLGDSNFTLTKKLHQFMYNWGSKKENAYITSLDKVGEDTWGLAKSYVKYGWVNGDNVPFRTTREAYILSKRLRGGIKDEIAKHLRSKQPYLSIEQSLQNALPLALQEQNNYVLAPVTTSIKTWEGICHGWSTAAGIVPRPRRTIGFDLDGSRKLNFFPDDIKGLASLMWANNQELQNTRYYDNFENKYAGGGVFVEGYRCNDKNPPKDPWGRYYDIKLDFQSGELKPACVGVHPGIWHLSLVNIMGDQGRSFIVERQTTIKVDNHPLFSYSMKFFNPKTGQYFQNINSNITTIDKKDQFLAYRNPDAKYIVGVRLKMNYINNEDPKRSPIDDESMDSVDSKEMIYDLEMDESFNIVGGQWRVVEAGRPRFLGKRERTQPDFFWVVTKDWQSLFKPNTSLPKWNGVNTLPPAEYKQAAIKFANNKYSPTKATGFPERCLVVRDKRTKLNSKIAEEIKVNCTHSYDKPLPLFEVVNHLVDLAK